MFNETRNWFKHPTENLGDELHIEEFETAIMLVRATSKFMARYNNKASNEMGDFIEWCRKHNYLHN